VTNILRVRSQIIQNATNPMLGTHYFGAALDPSTAADAVAAFWTDLAEVMRNDTETNVLSNIDSINVATGVLEDTTTIGAPDPISGGQSGDPLPFATQGLIRLNTGVIAGGRKVAGRVFVPCLVEGGSENGVPTSTVVNSLTSAGQNLIDASGGHWVVWSRKNHLAATVSDCLGWTQFAVQRKRRS